MPSNIRQELDYYINLTVSCSRYEYQPWTPSLLHTMCRQNQESQEVLWRQVVMADHSGLGVAHYSRVTEVSRSGLPHCHSLCWRREEDTSPDSVSALLGRLQRREGNLTWEERGRVVQLGRAALTVSMSPASLRQQFPQLTQQEVEEAVTLARCHQLHTCSHHCNGSCPEDQVCGQYFPRLPCLLPLLALRPPLRTPAQRDRLEALEKIAVRVQGLLRAMPVSLQPGGETEPVASLLLLLHRVAPPPVSLQMGGFLWAGAVFPLDQELQHLIQECRAMANRQEDQVLLAIYHVSITSRRHAKLLPLRQVSECWVVNFNPWLLKMSQSNVEIDIVSHTLPQLQYYLTKGATNQTIGDVAEEVHHRGGSRMADLAERLTLAAEAGWKEVSLTEALLRLDPNLNVYSSNCSVLKIYLEPNYSSLVLLYKLRQVFCKSYIISTFPGQHSLTVYQFSSLLCGTGWSSKGRRRRSPSTTLWCLWSHLLTPLLLPASPSSLQSSTWRTAG